MSQPHQPYIPATANEPELTFKAVFSGIFMACILGAANAYVGIKAGMTISAMFPAAVVAIALFRIPWLKGGILEQNIARTTAAVGEALVAGAVFTIPAFVLMEDQGQKIWPTFDFSHYWEATAIMLAGGLLGVLLIIILRRPMCVEMGLPFPESTACFEIVKTGQKGASGAGYVFGTMGIGALLQLFKDERGIQLFRESVSHIFTFPRHTLSHKALGDEPILHGGGMPLETPAASPALIGIGYIIGPRLSFISFAGSLFAWMILIPLILFLDPRLGGQTSAPLSMDLAVSVWKDIIRPMAVGAMLVGAIYTLFMMRQVIYDSIKGALKATSLHAAVAQRERTEIDLPLGWICGGTLALTLPLALLYYHYTHNLTSALLAAGLMLIVTFLLSSVGGYLVGLIGCSNQPMSGITLTALILAAALMIGLGHRGHEGLVVVLVVTAVVCCALGTSGELLQDLKVGHLLGATPWKMQLAEIISVAVVSFFLYIPIMLLHQSYLKSGGIGGTVLTAPQASLFAQLIKGMVGGNIAWGLFAIGAMFSVGLIMIGAPSPMLIAVGMYLPFNTTSAIVVGGVFKWLTDLWLARKLKKTPEKETADQEKMAVENRGILLASGFIAGEAIAGIGLAAFSLLNIPSLLYWISGRESLALYASSGSWLSLVIFGVVAYTLIRLPLGKKK